MVFWSPYFKIFSNISIFDKYFIPNLMYIRFRVFFGKNIYTNYITKYLNIFEVLFDFCLNFFWNNDYVICCILY